MCGLVGLFAPDRAVVEELDLTSMMDSIVHRGPDGRGHFVSQNRRTQLGFVRLAIIDPAMGDQPFQDEHTGAVMVGNGEIYNYLELRKDPRLAEFKFRSQGDIEAAFALALCTGGGFVNELRGMFALALIEQQPRRLTLVRDRF